MTHALRDDSFAKAHTKQRLQQDRKFEKIACHFSMPICWAINLLSTRTVYGAHHLHQRHSEGLPSYQTILSNTPWPSLADLSVPKQKQRVKIETGQSCTHPYFPEKHCSNAVCDMVYKGVFFSSWHKKKQLRSSEQVRNEMLWTSNAQNRQTKQRSTLLGTKQKPQHTIRWYQTVLDIVVW